MTIRAKVARAIDAARFSSSFDAQATAAIDAFLAAAAEDGWRMARDKATRPMTIAAEKMGAGEAWAEDCWAAMRAAEPEFEWQDK